MPQKRVSDRYEIIRAVGGGGMADVYLAKDLILDRDVAVKVLKSQFAEDEEFIRRFRREAHSAAAMSHPNIVNIYDVGEEENEYYIVMEYVEGQTLKEYISANQRLSPEETVRILRQVTSAVAHAHDNHIVHRDIKPQNILISPNGTAKVTDFGISRAISDATITHTNSVLGSVHYLSPEQARGGYVTYQSDLYSLGVVAYEMLTGHVPFTADTPVSIAIKHMQDTFPSVKEKLSFVPQSLENLIMTAVAKEPQNRYLSGHTMLADLDTILDPSRVNEAAVVPVPFDENATRAMPAVSSKESLADNDQTKVSSGAVNQDTVSYERDKGKSNQKKRSKAFWVKTGTIIGLVMLAVILFLFWWIPSLLHVEDVEIPDNLIGEAFDEVEEQLIDLNLVVEADYRFDDEIEEGHVISHNPEAGRMVKEESTIRVMVSEGPEPMQMIDVTGETRERALNLLEEFDEVEIQYRETTDTNPDTVLEQDPEAGEEVIPAVTSVTLTISEYPVFTMPNLADMNRDEVLELLENEPLINLSFDEDYHPSTEEGKVISQNPGRGARIDEPTTVNVVFSMGPEPEEEEEPEEPVRVTVPFEVSIPEIEEEVNDEEPERYRVQISVTDMNSQVPRQVIDREITETTTFDVPMSVEPGESGFLILVVDGEEFDDSPYEYTYEQLSDMQ
ncbi:Stk1 family PASTA domain-containing Ser/Thr kinase [Salisediminibacterium beveridgei]|uniref:Serine/threonine-protein kinase PrkC n=1 Tax=Salisediminibacterium beveridgei TaxID=632773 RepID=A0A1D7QW47_9BACI|nr:Stk1 family PASTA domain-containing Ser/Thr kinase [Salisediminibacterium beveridgei]AOM83236.1 Serine/threonine protein kinase PrkC, regulator of stationary phase [Salisediminibacterium beveridgei]